MKKRNIVLTFLTIIGVITFLDRINIAVASDQIMTDLNISVEQWGWVLSAFILSYGLMPCQFFPEYSPIGALGWIRIFPVP